MKLLSHVFETCASTNSATPAKNVVFGNFEIITETVLFQSHFRCRRQL